MRKEEKGFYLWFINRDYFMVSNKEYVTSKMMYQFLEKIEKVTHKKLIKNLTEQDKKYIKSSIRKAKLVTEDGWHTITYKYSTNIIPKQDLTLV